MTPAALAHPGGAHPVAQAEAVEIAGRDNAVPGSTTRDTAHAPTKRDVGQGLARGRALRFRQFGRVEIRQSHLDPTGATDTRDGFDAEAVAVTDVSHHAGEGLAASRLGRPRPAIRDAGAGIGKGWASGQRRAEGQQEGGSRHGNTVADREAVQ